MCTAGARPRPQRKSGNTQLMNNRSKQQQKSKQQPKNTPRKQRAAPKTLIIPRNMIISDRLKTTLRFWKALAFDMSVNTTQAARFAPSAAYDIDPTVLSTAMPGFGQYSQFYNSYRVTASRCVVEIVNTSPNSAIQAVLLPANTDPGATPSAGYIVASREQSYAKSTMVTSQGGPVAKLTSHMTTQKMFGSPMVKYDDKFAALTDQIPENNWYWVVTLYTLATITSTTPILVNVFLDVDVTFYDRANLVRT